MTEINKENLQDAYLSRNELLSKAQYGRVSVFEIMKASTAAVKPVRTGKWVKYNDTEYLCSECSAKKECNTLNGEVLPPYCEQCGAELKKQ